MKKSLQEELERIHGITYGNNVINEGFIDTILQKVGLKGGKSEKKDDEILTVNFNCYFIEMNLSLYCFF